MQDKQETIRRIHREATPHFAHCNPRMPPETLPTDTPGPWIQWKESKRVKQDFHDVAFYWADDHWITWNTSNFDPYGQNHNPFY